jgi:hypothetical protein
MVRQALFLLTAALGIILQAARAAPPAAAAHLRGKYEALAVNGQIETAEDFIDKAASSSMSGQAYLIRCGGGAPMTTRQWFSAALARHRGASGAQRSLRATPSAVYARTLPFASMNLQSSSRTLRSLWTDLTCSVLRATDSACSMASWLLAVPVNHTTPSRSVST